MQVFFQDEVRFGQQGSLTRVWAPTGSRPRAVRQTQYQYVYVVGAACAQSGQAEAIIVPYLNTAVINLFLEQFSAALPDDVHALLVWDGAGYHRSGTLKIPANITVVPLPAYSPELNPIENLWHFLKSHYWANRVYHDYDALFQMAMDTWRRVCLDPANIQSLCATPYATGDVIE